MKNGLGISNAEWAVMECVWTAQPITAQEIILALEAENDWKPQTVKSLISRLVKKEALVFDKIGNRYLYRSSITRDEAVKQETQSFLARIGKASLAPLLSQFVESSAPLTEQELSELKEILEEKGNSK